MLGDSVVLERDRGYMIEPGMQYVPVIPDTWAAEARGMLEFRNSAWATETPS